jgi:hypothetical protein
MTDVGRALKQIAEIHEQLAKGEVYRGWRPVPVALSGVVGLAAATWQSTAMGSLEPWGFTLYWLAVAAVAILVGCAEIAWHYLLRSTETERRQSRQVIGQFLPALVAGAIATVAVMRLSPALVALLPGLWALFFGVGVFAARPYVPRQSIWVALYYWTTGLGLLWFAQGADQISPWTVGGTFGVGQLVAAATLYWNLERRT